MHMLKIMLFHKFVPLNKKEINFLTTANNLFGCNRSLYRGFLLNLLNKFIECSIYAIIYDGIK
jgi:hypothetical protein